MNFPSRFFRPCPGPQVGPVLSPAPVDTKDPIPGGKSRAPVPWRPRGIPARGMGRGWKSRSSPGDRCPSPCWGHPRSCAVTRSGDIAPVPAPTPGPAGTWFSKELGGFQELPEPPKGRESWRFHPFPSEHRCSLSPGQRWSSERLWKGGKNTPSSTGKGLDPLQQHPQLEQRQIPAAGREGSAGFPALFGAPWPLPAGETEARRSGGRLFLTQGFPGFAARREEREPEQLRGPGVGISLRVGKGKPPPCQPQQNIEGFWVLQRGFRASFSLPGANPWSRAPEGSHRDPLLG